MSNQAERIRAFKLAQHARIQKQEDEEQWISSEELCTEGSSDEETHACIKTSQRKPKRNIRTEKRGISPLAQPPKFSEPTSTYQTGSQYLLPDTNFTNRVADVPSSSRMTEKSNASDTQSSSKQVAEISEAAKSFSLSEDDVYDDEETEQMIQWRPKRGSIKLPDFDEGRSMSLNHMVLESNLFYQELSMNIKSLKRKSYVRKRLVKSEANNSNQFHFVDPDIYRLMKSVSKLDNQISIVDLLFENEKQERQRVEKELCSTYSNSDLTAAHSKDLQQFLELCKDANDDTNDNKNEPAEINNKSKCNNEQAKRKIKKEEPTFVKRNIELAKHNQMTELCLTDEEKRQLDSLLSDLDSDQYVLPENRNEQILVELQDPGEKNEQPAINYFKLENGEMAIISNLDHELNEILHSYNENDDQNALAQHKEIPTLEAGDSLESTDKQGKFWKHFQLEKRLDTIEKELESISLIDLEEQKKQELNDLLENNMLENVKNNRQNN